MQAFTLVSTVFNEMQRLPDTLLSIKNLQLQPMEIIITDAGSTDGTYDYLCNWAKDNAIKTIILQQKGCNVAQGRNLAIEKASHSLILSTDFGCTFHPQWSNSLISAFEDKNIALAGGNFTVDKNLITTNAAIADYILQGGYSYIPDKTFTVSSRSIAYYKWVWEKVGKYPEWLTLAADDTIFWRKALQCNIPYVIVKESYVFWIRHKSFKAFAKEASRYGRGDGESGINFRNLLSHIAETGLRYSILLSIILLLIPATPFKWVLIFFGIFQLFGLRSYYYAVKKYIRIRYKPYHLLYCFYLTEISRIAYIKAYIKAYFFQSDSVKNQAKNLKLS